MRKRTSRRAATAMAWLLGTALSVVPAAAQRGAADGQWASYGGDDGSTKYAPLDQIDAGNVDQLDWQVPRPTQAG